MCTVTFMPHQTGYCLAMNRDEKLARRSGLSPSLRILENRRVICPSEFSGGTWIALNDAGVSLALINWYSVPERVTNSPITRGLVVSSSIAAEHPTSVQTILADLPLEQINAFRLIGVFPSTGEIAEWRWDLNALERKDHPWETQHWISSGFDEPAAQHERNRTFQRALKQKSAGSLNWLRRLHRSHAPQRGPFSICIHRADAATVSYTEVLVLGREARLLHRLGSPCPHRPWHMLCLKPGAATELAARSLFDAPQHIEASSG